MTGFVGLSFSNTLASCLVIVGLLSAAPQSIRAQDFNTLSKESRLVGLEAETDLKSERVELKEREDPLREVGSPQENFASDTGTSPSIAAFPTLTGAQDLLVVPITFGGDQMPTGCLPENIHNTIFNYVNTKFRANSYNTFWFNEVITPLVNLPVIPNIPCTDADTAEMRNAARDAAASIGRNINDFPRILYIAAGPLPPSCASGGYGMATLDGNPTVALAGCAPGTVVHELGHNLGMRHASTPPETSENYQDGTCPMGSGGAGHFNAPHKAQVGWIPPSKVLTVTQSGVYDVAPLDLDPATTTYPSVIKVRRNYTSTTDFYYLSYRRPVGIDQYLLTAASNKVSVHTQVANLTTYLRGFIGDGESFTAPETGAAGSHTTFLVLSHDATRARIQINVAPPVMYTLQGTILANGQPLSGVRVFSQELGQSALTNQSGVYQFPNVATGTLLNIVPIMSGYSFSPSSFSTMIVGNKTQNFAASNSVTYDLSGQVQLDGAPVANQLINEFISGRSIRTDTNGNYRFEALPAGSSYSLYINGGGHQFAPSNPQGTLGADTAINFQAYSLVLPPTPTPTLTPTISPTPTFTPTPVVTLIPDIVLKDHVSDSGLWMNAQGQFMASTDTAAPPSVPGITFIGNGEKLTKVGAVFSFSDRNFTQNATPTFERFQLEVVFFPTLGQFSQYAPLLNGTNAVSQVFQGPTNPGALTVVGHTATNDNLYYLELDVSENNIVTTPGQLQAVSVLVNTWGQNPGLVGFIAQSVGGSTARGLTPDWAQPDPCSGATANRLSVITTSSNWAQPMNWLAGRVLSKGTNALGACCIQSHCAMFDSASCAQAGGTYQYSGLQCGTANNPTVCCPINFDQIDGVTPEDIFAYMHAFFAGESRGDFNHDGMLTLQDMFDFLNAWFVGC